MFGPLLSRLYAALGVIRRVGALLRALLIAAVAGGSLLLLAWLTLCWGILPYPDLWRPKLEQWASAQWQAPVSVEALEVSMDGWRPRLVLRQLRVGAGAGSGLSDNTRAASSQDTASSAVLRLPEVRLWLSPRSLLRLEPVAHRLEIDTPELELRRDAQSRWWLAGWLLPASATPPASAAPADPDAPPRWWPAAQQLLAQGEIRLQAGRLRWVDELGGSASATLEDIELVLRRRLSGHTLRLAASPPVAWGGRLSLEIDLTRPLRHRLRPWPEQWSARLQASVPALDALVLRAALPQLGALLPPLFAGAAQAELVAGTASAAGSAGSARAAQLRGDLHASAELEAGRWQHFSLDAQLQHLALAGVELRQLRARLTLERSGPQGWLLQARRLAFQTPDGQRWPASQLQLRWQPEPHRFDLQASQLHLGLLAQMLRPWTGLPPALRDELDALAPQGRVQDLRLSWAQAQPVATYQLSARISGLHLAPGVAHTPGEPARPGVEGLDATVQASERGGSAHLTLAEGRGALSFPGVFDEPRVPFEHLSARLAWQLHPRPGGGLPDIEVRVPELHFSNQDAQGQLRARWATRAPDAQAKASGEGRRSGNTLRPVASEGARSRLPGHLWLEGSLLRGQARRVPRYLPQVLPADVRHYLGRALRAGQLEGVRFLVDGPLLNFPFADGSGDFRITGQLREGEFVYVPSVQGAPNASGATAATSTADAADSAAETPPWPPLTELVAELSFERTRMDIRNARARSAGLWLRSASATIADLAHQPLLEVQGEADGPALAGLAFVSASPVGGWLHQVLEGVQAEGPLHLNLDLRLPLLALEATQVRGRIQLGQAGEPAALRWRPGLPWLREAQGQVDFTERAFSVETRGMALGGQQHIRVAQPEGQPLGIEASGEFHTRHLHELHRLDGLRGWPEVLGGQTRYQLQARLLEAGWALRLDSELAGLGLNLPAPLDKPSAERWPLRLHAQPLPAGAQGLPRTQLALSLAAPVPLRAQLALAWPPDAVPRLEGGVLALGSSCAADAGSGTDADSGVGADADSGADSGADASASAGGKAQAKANKDAPLHACVRLPALDLQAWRDRLVRWQAGASAEAAAASAPQAASVAGQQPPAISQWINQLPALSLAAEVDQLRWGPQLELGRMEAQLLAQPAAQHWQLTGLQLNNPDAQLFAQGHWTPASGSQLELNLQLQDIGQALARSGLPGVMRGGQGQITAQLHAGVSPMAWHPALLGGQARIQLNGGQILKIDPGLARLLGVLNAESLPRRLTLDFRDVLGQGLAVDQITGDVVLARGIARTSNLRLQSVQALALLDGQADLRHQTLDMTTLIVPQLSAGTASLAYAAVNPAIGLGTYLAQRLLRPQLLQAGAMEYRLLGPWLELLIEPVQRSFTEPLPPAALEEPLETSVP